MVNFLDVHDVLVVHADQIDWYGGADGLRDLGLLDSALAQPQATFGGDFLHADLFEMAAAYLYHIVRNHPFLDGNKRTGLAAALVFLDLNGRTVDAPKGSLHDLTIAVATGQTTKADTAEFFRSHAH